MATSYVEYNSSGFWLHDRYLSALLYLIQKHLRKINTDSAFLNQMIENLFDASTIGYIGTIPNYISDFNSNKKLDYLRHAIFETIDELNNYTNELVIDLNKNQVGGYSWTAIPRKELLEISKLLLKLINGEIKTDASSKIDYLDFN